MPKLWFFAGAKGTPDTSVDFEDSDSEWHEALSSPEVVEKAQKNDSPAICGAEFAPGAKTKEQTPDNLLWSHALVFDVDVWDHRAPFSLEELLAEFEGIRAIGWNTFSSSPAEKRWRVVVPLAAPMPPGKYRAICQYFNECLGYTMAESTFDAGRLGFFGTVNSETAKEDYQYFISQGEYFDWRVLDLEEEDLHGHKKALDPLDLTRNPDWISDDQALKSAKRYFKRSGEEVDVGNRHAHLLKVACRLWWEWALDEESVRIVLHEVNQSFPEPKPDADVETEIIAAYDRVFGENRVEQPSLFGAQRDPIDRSSVATIEEHARRLRRSQEDAQRLVGRALTHIAKGEPFGDAAEARNLIAKAAEELARTYPRDTPERLLDLMRPSLRAQRNAGSTANVPTDVEILNIIRHTQGISRKRQEEKEKEKQDDLTHRIEQATNYARSTPYSPQEYRKYEREGLTDRRWILWHGRSFYFFSNGDYVGPFAEREAQLGAYMHFAAAEDRVKLSVMTSDGKVRRLTIDELAATYGSPVQRVYCCLNKDKTSYNPREGVLELVKTPLRDLDAVYSKEIDEWLRRLADDKYDLLCEWLAAVTYLDKPLSALYLCTKKGQGKNLFVEGLARLWSTGGFPHLNGFKPEYAELCPLVLCDEKLPFEWKKDVSGKLRTFISQSVRPVSRKYQNDYFLTGYFRLIFASNTPAMFRGEDSISLEEQSAYADRVLMINTLKHNSDVAGQYLRLLSQNGFVLDDFIYKDIFAKHVLWLRDNHSVDFRKRFFVQDSQEEFAKAVAISDPTQAKVLEWVFSFLENGRFRNDAVLCKTGTLFVNSTYMLDDWDEYFSDKKDISVAKLGRALSKISNTSCFVERAGASQGTKKKRYYKLREDVVDYWATAHSYDTQMVQDMFQKLEKEKGFTIA